jgi:hypothetical protein
MERESQINTDIPSLLFIIWFIIWVIALLVLPRDYHDTIFIILGIAPVAGWFLIKPKRIIWVTKALLGINGLDKQ